jgi:hypothetical protein
MNEKTATFALGDSQVLHLALISSQRQMKKQVREVNARDS